MKKADNEEVLTRHFINMAYLGAPFHGWQVQPGAISVQETVENALATLFRQRVPVTGAGRTDAGVNASMMIAHADLPERVDDDARLVRALNSILGRDIAVRWVRPVHPDAHARFDAVARTYHYYVHTRRNPFVGKLSWLAPHSRNFDLMNEAAAEL
ncbi:MAG: tRNA pseudouridine(38-40) synthase TruA, partial [Muribaculaceae bacterium]|nr:tRNA pseudouridine(38-40) synthase TruA [Muribaculaceae bacterium]